jgi:hypothetical protein
MELLLFSTMRRQLVIWTLVGSALIASSPAAATDRSIRLVVNRAQRDIVAAKWFVKASPDGSISTIEMRRSVNSITLLQSQLLLAQAEVRGDRASTARGRLGRTIALQGIGYIITATKKRIAFMESNIRGDPPAVSNRIDAGEEQAFVNGLAFLKRARQLLTPQ